MKNIPEPDLEGAVILKPADMNKIHFGGNHTPLTPEQISALVKGETTTAPKVANSGKSIPSGGNNSL